MPRAIATTLPLPPSTNRLWRKTKTGMMLSPAYKAWKKEAGWMLCAQRIRPIVCETYEFTLFVPARMRGDCDNRAKAVVDLFSNLHLTPDDKHLSALTIKRHEAVSSGMCWIRIVAAESTANEVAA